MTILQSPDTPAYAVPDENLVPANVLGVQGGRDGLVESYQAMLALGHGRLGDVVVVSRVPWISFNWGPYGIGANVLWAPGHPSEGWTYTENSLRACVEFTARYGRKIAGLVITCPDNPTGLTISLERQAALARTALQSGMAFVLMDRMYHYVIDESPNDLNAFPGLIRVEICPIPQDDLSHLGAHVQSYCQEQGLELNVSFFEPGIACDPANESLLKLIQAVRNASELEPFLGRKLPGTSARFAPQGQGVVWGQSGIGPHAKNERHYIPSILPFYRALQELGTLSS